MMAASLRKTDRIMWSAMQDQNKVPAERRCLAYEHFKAGKDTYEIAKETGLHESIICRWIDQERNKQW